MPAEAVPELVPFSGISCAFEEEVVNCFRSVSVALQAVWSVASFESK